MTLTRNSDRTARQNPAGSKRRYRVCARFRLYSRRNIHMIKIKNHDFSGTDIPPRTACMEGEDDFDAFAAMNADPRVMEVFPRPLTREGVGSILRAYPRRVPNGRGSGFTPLERISDGSLLGYGSAPRNVRTGCAARSRSDGGCVPTPGATATPRKPHRRASHRHETWHRGDNSFHRRRQPALAAGHAKKSAWSAWASSTTLPCRKDIPAAACALLDRNQGIDSVNGQARSRIAAEYPGLLMPATTPPRNHRVCGVLPFRQRGTPPRRSCPRENGCRLSAARIHSAAPGSATPTQRGLFQHENRRFPRMSSDAAPT